VLAWYSELLGGRNLVQGLEVLAALIAAFIVGGWLSGATLVLLGDLCPARSLPWAAKKFSLPWADHRTR
jgi:hypothetical protein